MAPRPQADLDKNMSVEKLKPMFKDIDPPNRLLMGPGPANVYPRVLRAMSAQMLGQFDPEFTEYMDETMALYRYVFQTENRWTFLVDGTARAAIEAALVSLINPGDVVLVVRFGRFGLLLTEIVQRCGGKIETVDAEWGATVPLDAIEEAARKVRPRLIATVHGDTSTTMAQPLAGLADICRKYDCLSYVDATATLGGMAMPVDDWGLDIVTAGLQKCLGGPAGSAPITISPKAEALIFNRRHVEKGIAPPDLLPGNGPMIRSNYFDLAMLMDYWSERRLNHHTESASMLYAARECGRLVVEEGLAPRLRRHQVAGKAMVAGLQAMGLTIFGDAAFKMDNVVGIEIPNGVDGEAVRTRMREDFQIEIGSSFGPLRGRIWRIGTMGYNCRRHNVLITLGALEAVLRHQSFKVPAGDGVDAALRVYEAEEVAPSHT
jgi:(S)-ureidoglycine-glyoxylate aminotransferase